MQTMQTRKVLLLLYLATKSLIGWLRLTQETIMAAAARPSCRPYPTISSLSGASVMIAPEIFASILNFSPDRELQNEASSIGVEEGFKDWSTIIHLLIE